MFSVQFVCVFTAGLLKDYWPDFHKTSGSMAQEKSPFNFRVDLNHRADTHIIFVLTALAEVSALRSQKCTSSWNI